MTTWPAWASLQVVAGINYHLKVLVEDEAGIQSVLETTVWSRPWLEAQNSADAWKVTQCGHTDVSASS